MDNQNGNEERKQVNTAGYLAKTVNKLNDKDELIIVGVGAIVVNRENRVLIGKRRDNGQWCVPGGSLEIGETLKQAAVRELFEETGIKANAESANLNNAESLTDPVIKNGRKLNIVSVSFIVNKYDDSEFNLNSREFQIYGWFNKNEYLQLENKASYTILALDKYFNI